MASLTEQEIAEALIRIFEASPELGEYEQGIIIQELAHSLQKTGNDFDENRFAENILRSEV